MKTQSNQKVMCQYFSRVLIEKCYFPVYFSVQDKNPACFSTSNISSMERPPCLVVNASFKFRYLQCKTMPQQLTVPFTLILFTCIKRARRHYKNLICFFLCFCFIFYLFIYFFQKEVLMRVYTSQQLSNHIQKNGHPSTEHKK